jgi:hypothetical protein
MALREGGEQFFVRVSLLAIRVRGKLPVLTTAGRNRFYRFGLLFLTAT